MYGHTTLDCYQLIGYLENFKPLANLASYATKAHVHISVFLRVLALDIDLHTCILVMQMVTQALEAAYQLM